MPFAKDDVKDAPKVDPDGQLSQSEEAELYRHYGMSYSESDSDTGLGEGGGRFAGGSDRGTARDDHGLDRSVPPRATRTTTAAPTATRLRRRTRRAPPATRLRRAGTSTGDTDLDRDASARGTVGRGRLRPETDDAMTRSEEELSVGTQSREAGRARLRKYVVTEEVEQTVPVRREEVRVEREPITDANVDDATSGPELSEEEHEVVLHEEEAVVEKRVVPKERVRLDKDVEVEEKTVSETVAREEIEVEGDASRRDR